MRLRKLVRSALTPAYFEGRLAAEDFLAEREFSPEEIAGFVEVVDNGAQTTMICFAGLAVDFVGLPGFEFRRTLQAAGEGINMVFVRDIRRSWYHLSPAGDADGPGFFFAELAGIVARLGGRRLGTIGLSAGGFAALYYGCLLGADRILAFSPQTDLAACRAFHWQPLIFGGGLWQDPRHWLSEQLSLALIMRRRMKLIGERRGERPWGSIAEAHARNPNPDTRIAIHFGQGSHLDVWHARRLAHLSGVSLHPCETPVHNVAAYLRERGELQAKILAHVLD
jgi:hypothetical protein